VGNTFNTTSGTIAYACEYVVTSDLDPSNPVTCMESECPIVVFDEEVSVDYSCQLDPGLADRGTVRVTGSAQIGTRDITFKIAETFRVN